MTAQPRLDYNEMKDVELAHLIASRDPVAVRLVTARNNQRLFRSAWSIVKCRAEAEDVVQTAYLQAFAAIERFEGRSSLSTWLTRIAINEALARKRSERRRRARSDQSVTFLDDYKERLMRGSTTGTSPDVEIGRKQVRELLEHAVANLPEAFRSVFVLRQLEGLSVEETAEVLDLNPTTVKTRFLRARRKLQDMLEPELRNALVGTFPFAGADCQRLTDAVVSKHCTDF